MIDKSCLILIQVSYKWANKMFVTFIIKKKEGKKEEGGREEGRKGRERK